MAKLFNGLPKEEVFHQHALNKFTDDQLERIWYYEFGKGEVTEIEDAKPDRKDEEKRLAKRLNLPVIALAIMEADGKNYRVYNGKVYNTDGKQVKSHRNKRGYWVFPYRSEYGTVHKIPVYRLMAYQKYGDVIFKQGIYPIKVKDGNKNNLEWENIVITEKGREAFNRLYGTFAPKDDYVPYE